MINGFKLIKEPNAEDILKNIPMVSWSEISSMQQDNEKQYSVPQSSVRETLAHSLAAKTSALKKIKMEESRKYNIFKFSLNLQTYKSSTNKSYELTPKAVKLLNSVKRGKCFI
jgi:hypothetical protein